MHPDASTSSPGLLERHELPDEHRVELLRVEELRVHLMSYPSDVRALLRLGDAHIRLDEHERALSCYERVAEIYAAEGLLVKAVAVFKQIHWVIERHAPALADRYQHTEARLAEVFEALGLHDDATALWRRIAKRYVDRGDEADAMAVLVHVLELSPHAIQPRLVLATLKARAGDIEGALLTLEQVVTLALSHHRRDDAIRALQRAFNLRENVDHARLLAELLLERGGDGDAIEALTKLSLCYRANPKSLPTLRLLVQAFDRVGQPERANAVLKESARIVFESGARDAFNRIVNALLERAPDDPEVAELDTLHEPVLLTSTSAARPRASVVAAPERRRREG